MAPANFSLIPAARTREFVRARLRLGRRYCITTGGPLRAPLASHARVRAGHGGRGAPQAAAQPARGAAGEGCGAALEPWSLQAPRSRRQRAARACHRGCTWWEHGHTAPAAWPPRGCTARTSPAAKDARVHAPACSAAAAQPLQHAAARAAGHHAAGGARCPVLRQSQPAQPWIAQRAAASAGSAAGRGQGCRTRGRGRAAQRAPARDRQASAASVGNGGCAAATACTGACPAPGTPSCKPAARPLPPGKAAAAATTTTSTTPERSRCASRAVRALAPSTCRSPPHPRDGGFDSWRPA